MIDIAFSGVKSIMFQVFNLYLVNPVKMTRFCDNIWSQLDNLCRMKCRGNILKSLSQLDIEDLHSFVLIDNHLSNIDLIKKNINLNNANDAYVLLLIKKCKDLLDVDNKLKEINTTSVNVIESEKLKFNRYDDLYNSPNGTYNIFKPETFSSNISTSVVDNKSNASNFIEQKSRNNDDDKNNEDEFDFVFKPKDVIKIICTQSNVKRKFGEDLFGFQVFVDSCWSKFVKIINKYCNIDV